MIYKTITLKFIDGSRITKNVYGANEIILSRNIQQVVQSNKACGWSTQSINYHQGR
jgi:hypothetical protein